MRVFPEGERWDLLCGFIAGIAVAVFLVSAFPAALGLRHIPVSYSDAP